MRAQRRVLGWAARGVAARRSCTATAQRVIGHCAVHEERAEAAPEVAARATETRKINCVPRTVDVAMEVEEREEAEPAAGKRQRGKAGKAVAAPVFEQVKPAQLTGGKSEFRRVAVPQNRYTPLRKDWMSLYTPIVEQLKLDVRMNPRNRSVELKTSEHTEDIEVLQKAVDFLKAYFLGFAVSDALAMLRVEDLFVESFSVTDVKMLKGDHLSRAVGRIAGKDGKCKYAIENATRTRIVLADNRVHILGSFARIRLARDAICALIMGSPISKVYVNLRTTAGRLAHKI